MAVTGGFRFDGSGAAGRGRLRARDGIAVSLREGDPGVRFHGDLVELHGVATTRGRPLTGCGITSARTENAKETSASQSTLSGAPSATTRPCLSSTTRSAYWAARAAPPEMPMSAGSASGSRQRAARLRRRHRRRRDDPAGWRHQCAHRRAGLQTAHAGIRGAGHGAGGPRRSIRERSTGHRRADTDPPAARALRDARRRVAVGGRGRARRYAGSRRWWRDTSLHPCSGPRSCSGTRAGTCAGACAVLHH